MAAVVAILVAGEDGTADKVDIADDVVAEPAFVIISGKLSRGRLPLRCLKVRRPFEGTTAVVVVPTALPSSSPPSTASFERCNTGLEAEEGKEEVGCKDSLVVVTEGAEKPLR